LKTVIHGLLSRSIKPNDFNAFNEDAAPNRFIFRIACFFLEVFLIDLFLSDFLNNRPWVAVFHQRARITRVETR